MVDRTLIELVDISRTFVTDELETHALSNLSLTIDRGEYVSIEGPSGCGKSTLLSLIGLLDAPSAGRYALAGTNVERLGATERARVRNRDIGFIFQNFNLLGELDVLGNVELPLVYRGLAARERTRRATTALERVGMAHRLHHRPTQLSGGQQQRVAVARALAGEPLLLLADEPTGNLDSVNGAAVMDLLADLHANGSTICMVTHDPRFERYASRTIHLLDGRIKSVVPSIGASSKSAEMTQ